MYRLTIFLLIKVNWYTFRGSYSTVLRFASLLYGDLLFRKRICSCLGANSFTFRVDPILEGFHCPGKETGSHKKCVPLKNGGLLWWCTHTPKCFHALDRINNFMPPNSKNLRGHIGLILSMCL